VGTKVFKFGGASVKDASAVKNLSRILRTYKGEKLVVVVSAMGKTTNALEKVVEAYARGDENAEQKIKAVKDYHSAILNELFEGAENESTKKVRNYFEALEETAKNEKGKSYDEFYDAVVSFGELISTEIIHGYLLHEGYKSHWADVRQVLFTNSYHREAKVDWQETQKRIANLCDDSFKTADIVVTQGFIAADKEGNTTTLGREGSDFTGAVFAYALNADSLTIWKDVPGLLNADPKYFKDTKKIDTLSYGETVELAFYGATIIHPKTIKPLQNKLIPLFVKSFLQPAAEGTLIHDDSQNDSKLPSYIFKKNQILISISPRDYSFMDENNLAVIFSSLAKYHIKVNVMQNSAISFSVCVDNGNNKVDNFIEDVKKDYRVRYNRRLELLTIRHYTQELIEKLTGNRKIYLEQRSRATVQIVMDAPEIKQS